MTGSLSGAVADPDGGALPGVTVTATNGAIKRSEVTNNDGRFAFAGLPVGWYRVEAVLAGFGRVVQDPVVVRSTAMTHITVRMKLGGLLNILSVALPPAEATVMAAVVAHVTTMSSRTIARDSAPAVEWLADVHTAVKDAAGLVRDQRIRFLQYDAGTIREDGRLLTGSSRPFGAGEELIVFLGIHNGEVHALAHTQIAVRSGVAQWPMNSRGGRPGGLPLADALAQLREFADQATKGPGKEKELTLKQGLSLPWPGTRLGHSREFDNDIYGLKCSPIATVGERVLQWIHRLHITTGRAFVEPCEELEVNQPESKAPRPAAFADQLFEATLGGDDAYPQIALRRLALPGWIYQSNGAFCGSFVAYWSIERDPDQTVALHARIANLFTQQVVARERLGPVSTETDNPGAFEKPVWDDSCREATMSGQRYGLPVTRLKVPG